MNVRLARLQQGIFEALGGVADLVAWGHQNQPREDDAGSILSLRLDSGNSRVISKINLFPISSLELLITGSTSGGLALANVNGLEAHHKIGGSETLQTVRDSLLADLQALAPEPFTASTVSTDRISLSANSLGGLWRVHAAGSVQVDGATVEMATDAVEVRQVREVYTLILEAYSGETEPRLGAHAIVSDALGRLEDADLLVELGRFGVKRWEVGEANDLSAIAGAYWESRVRVPIEIAIRNVRVAPRDRIEDVTLNITANE